jgi:hypothetical protein
MVLVADEEIDERETELLGEIAIGLALSDAKYNEILAELMPSVSDDSVGAESAMSTSAPA